MTNARARSGEIKTLADARAANYMVEVCCDRCSMKRRMHPYTLMNRHKRLIEAPLNEPLYGFYCMTCRSKVQVIIRCTYTQPGSLQ